jgi:hypothetical protein
MQALLPEVQREFKRQLEAALATAGGKEGETATG